MLRVLVLSALGLLLAVQAQAGSLEASLEAGSLEPDYMPFGSWESSESDDNASAEDSSASAEDNTPSQDGCDMVANDNMFLAAEKLTKVFNKDPPISKDDMIPLAENFRVLPVRIVTEKGIITLTGQGNSNMEYAQNLHKQVRDIMHDAKASLSVSQGTNGASNLRVVFEGKTADGSAAILPFFVVFEHDLSADSKSPASRRRLLKSEKKATCYSSTESCKTTDSETQNIPVYWNGKDAIQVARNIVQSGYVATYFHSLSATNQKQGKITVNETHVTFPGGVDTQSSFARNHSQTGSAMVDAGVENFRVVYTPESLFKGTVALIASKAHVLYHSGKKWDSSSHYTEQTKAQKIDAEARGHERNTYANLVVQSGTAVQVLNSGMDLPEIDKLKELHGTKDESKRTSYLSQQTKDLKNVAKDMDPAVMKSLGSEDHCFHFGGKLVDANSERVVIPLNREIDTYRGTVATGERRAFDLYIGTSVFTYNNGNLEISTGVTQFNSFPDPDRSKMKPNFYTGPVDGQQYAVNSNDGRNGTSNVANDKTHDAYKKMVAIPLDFSLLYKDTAKECETAGKMGAELETILSSLPEHDSMTTPQSEVLSNWMQDMSAFAAVAFGTDSVPCGNVFLRSDGPKKNAYDILEAEVWLHYMLEQPMKPLEAFWEGLSNRKFDDNVITAI